MKTAAHSVVSFLNNTSVFWLSHLAIGEVSLPSVMAHQLLLLRLIKEESLAFAVSYEHRLQLFLADEARAGNTRDVSFDISYVIDSLRRDLDNARKPTPPHVAPVKAVPAGAAARAAAAPKAAARKGGGKGGGSGKAVAALGQPPVRKRVCLKHDSRAGKTCRDSKCMSELEHLDTAQPALAERFDRASAAFAASEARRVAAR